VHTNGGLRACQKCQFPPALLPSSVPQVQESGVRRQNAGSPELTVLHNHRLPTQEFHLPVKEVDMRTLTATLLLVVAAPLSAQEIGADSATPAVQGYAPGGPPPSNPAASDRGSADAVATAGKIVLPPRSEAVLQQAMKTAEADLRRADARLSRAGASRSNASALVQQRKLEVREIEGQIRTADKAKRKGDKRRLEKQKESLERQMRWAERLQDTETAEVETARAASRVAFAKHQALGLESQLAQTRNETGPGVSVKPLSGESTSMVIRQLELQTLEAQQKFRKLAHELARQEEELAGMRINLYKSASK
jgi:hypothetical protein